MTLNVSFLGAGAEGDSIFYSQEEKTALQRSYLLSLIVVGFGVGELRCWGCLLVASSLSNLLMFWTGISILRRYVWEGKVWNCVCCQCYARSSLIR